MWLGLLAFAAPILFDLTKIFNLDSESNSIPHQARYSPREKQALLELRSLEEASILLQEVHPYFLNDHVLIRFLRAKNLDVQAAADMIIKVLKWRKDNRIDSIVNETTMEMPVQPYTFEGHDNDGRPVAYLTPTFYDLRRLLLAGKRAQIMRSLDQMLERGLVKLRDISLSGRKSPDGQEITQFVVVLDASGYSPAKHLCIECISVFTELFSHYESFYFDSLKYVIVVNVPKAALPLYDMAKTVISAATKSAIKLFGPHKSAWSAFLRSIIPEDQLPIRYGGKKISRLNF